MNLFDAFPPAASTADPATSHAAGRALERSGERRRQTRAVAELVRLWPGRTTLELAALGQVDRYIVARRMSDAERAGWVTRGPERLCEESRRRFGRNLKAVTWEPAGEGK